MSIFISQLTKSEQARFLEKMNDMNLDEIRGFCSAREIPCRIVAEYPNGKVKATRDCETSTSGPQPVRRRACRRALLQILMCATRVDFRTVRA